MAKQGRCPLNHSLSPFLVSLNSTIWKGTVYNLLFNNGNKTDRSPIVQVFKQNQTRTEPIHVQMSNHSTQDGMSCQITHSHDADWPIALSYECWNRSCWLPSRFENFVLLVIVISYCYNEWQISLTWLSRLAWKEAGTYAFLRIWKVILFLNPSNVCNM